MFKQTAHLGLLVSILAVSPVQGQEPYPANAMKLNPDISLILSGGYASFGNNSDYELPGFMLGGEAGRGEEGFFLGHNELVMSANIDDRFYGKMTTIIADHEGETEVELEEAYIETIGLGDGLSVRGGRFFSGIGYLNSQHPHSWDFADAPLIYRGLFGNQLYDDGLQLSWLSPTELYMKMGLELMRGERFPAGGASNEGKGAYSLFLKLGGDVGASHAWQLGLSRWVAEVAERGVEGHAHGGATEVPTYSGDSEINGIDFVWKWAPRGNPSERNLKVQAEYFVRDEDGDIEMVGSLPLESSTYRGQQYGGYLQAIYQFMPRWRVGLRYDRLGSSSSGSDADVLTEAGVDNEGHTPARSSVMVDYSRSEYSRLRLQVARDDSYEESDTLVILQYVMSLGAHGAHAF